MGLCSLVSCNKDNDACCEDAEIPIETPAVVVDCEGENTLSFVGVDCPFDAPDNSLYTETLEGNLRKIVTNTVPNHIYGDYRNRFAPFFRSFSLPISPTLSTEKTSILNANNRPRYFFGVALNGVIFAPAPATPFIFENTSTGEYNWDWVFEASNNK
ncbi:MAG: hypothetical protein ACON43_09000, partial [Flavobacteriaceae bacterium]